jgi:hypothetical protein
MKRDELKEEVESWKGFPWALRKEDRELWDAMIHEVEEQFSVAVRDSGKALATDPFFMALILAQQKTIKRLQAELRTLGAEVSDTEAVTMTTLDI